MMNDSGSLPEPDGLAAVQMLKQALDPASRVISRDNAAEGYDAELHRGDLPPIHLRLRRWSPGARAHGDPGTVWVMKRAPRGTLQQMRDAGQNYIALSGAARLVTGWLFLDRTDLKPAQRFTFPSRSRRTQPFADRNSLVVRTLLASPGRTWGVRELANHAQVALGTASGVVRALADARLVRAERSGRTLRVRLDEPRRVLTQWFATYSWERNERAAFHAPMGDMERFVQRLPRSLEGERWALTMQAGAARVAPHAAWDRVHLYVAVSHPAELLAIGSRLGWEPGVDGRVVLMRPYYRDSVWHGLRLLEGVPVVSNIQLVLDLWDYPLRGREQAEHLLETVTLAG